MKAVVMDAFGAADVLRIGDVPVPMLQDHQVLIEVAATSVNRPDIIQREGRYPPPPGESEILGLECAGRIVTVGAGVTTHAVGDRVFALLGGGGYAELAAADALHCLPIPNDASFEEAACMAETWITAFLNLFLTARLADGECALVHGGSGGVGTAAIALIDALCPTSPIVVTASGSKSDRVRALGADLVVDYRRQNFADEVKAFSDRRGADVILDHIGATYFEKNLDVLAVDGRLVIIGIMQGSDTRLSLGRLMIKRQRIIGSVLRPRPATEKAEIIVDFARIVMPLFVHGRIKPVIDSVLPVERVADAHRRMEAGDHFGKIVLSFGKD
jgi:putative PIG3 family NAD(P)H quinone oxidoreductase